MQKTKTERFREWLASARPGQVYTYYRGFLSSDRGSLVDFGDGAELRFLVGGDIDEVASNAMDAYHAGSVHLIQRKIHDRDYEYIAVKRPR